MSGTVCLPFEHCPAKRCPQFRAHTIIPVVKAMKPQMRNRIFVIAILLLSAQFALAGAGNDPPTNIVVSTPYNNNINLAQFCWNTVNQSDSMVMIGEHIDFQRQVYDPALTTNHCVVVQNLQPGMMYYYSVASCTDPVGGKPCARTDPNWSVAPWPTTNPIFATAPSTKGPLGFNAFTFGPQYVYQNSAINIGINLIQTGGIVTNNDVLMLTQASIDGQSCLPGDRWDPCAEILISHSRCCAPSREEVNAHDGQLCGLDLWRRELGRRLRLLEYWLLWGTLGERSNCASRPAKAFGGQQACWRLQPHPLDDLPTRRLHHEHSSERSANCNLAVQRVAPGAVYCHPAKHFPANS